MPAPSQNLVCFLYRGNKKTSRSIQTSQQNSQLEYETACCPANVIQQNIQAYAWTSALKHLNRPEQKGTTAAAACLSPKSSTKISRSFVYYNPRIVGASCLLAAALICQLRVIIALGGSASHVPISCYAASQEQSRAQPLAARMVLRIHQDCHHKHTNAFKRIIQLNILYCKVRTKIIKKSVSSPSDNPTVFVCLANCPTMQVRIQCFLPALQIQVCIAYSTLLKEAFLKLQVCYL